MTTTYTDKTDKSDKTDKGLPLFRGIWGDKTDKTFLGIALKPAWLLESYRPLSVCKSLIASNSASLLESYHSYQSYGGDIPPCVTPLLGGSMVIPVDPCGALWNAARRNFVRPRVTLTPLGSLAWRRYSAGLVWTHHPGPACLSRSPSAINMQILGMTFKHKLENRNEQTDSETSESP